MQEKKPTKRWPRRVPLPKAKDALFGLRAPVSSRTYAIWSGIISHGITSFTQTQNLSPFSTGVFGSTNAHPNPKCLHPVKHQVLPENTPQQSNEKGVYFQERRADFARSKVRGPEPRRTLAWLMEKPFLVSVSSSSPTTDSMAF